MEHLWNIFADNVFHLFTVLNVAPGRLRRALEAALIWQLCFFPRHSAATSLVSGPGLVVLGSAVSFPVRSSWWQWGPKRKQNFRQLFLSCNQTKRLIHAACHSGVVSRRCFHVFVIGGFVLVTYIMRPCRRPEPQHAALTSGSLQHSVCHKENSIVSIKPEQTIAETQHMVM